jgi:hypothetical protein
MNLGIAGEFIPFVRQVFWKKTVLRFGRNFPHFAI